MANFMSFLRLLAFTASLSCGYCQLNQFISYFEVLDYEAKYKQFKTGQRSNERSMEKVLFIDFKAFGREFKLFFSKDTTATAPGTTNDASYNGVLHLHQNSLVAGKRIDQSQVYGWIEDPGLFYGAVKSQNNTFYIEPAKKYFKTARFHSVIYRSEDINDSQHRLRSKFREGGSEQVKLRVHKVRKRDISTNPNLNIDLKVCRLSLEADYSFLKRMGSHSHAIASMVDHIKALDAIFEKSLVNGDRLLNETVFALDGNDSVIQFQIAKVRVYNESETWRVLGAGALDAATFLRRMQDNAGYSRYCLALFFTARSFMEGVVGVATPGGACTTFNVGVVSFTREGMSLPPQLTKIAVAHVVGQALGAKHDQEDHCQLGGDKNDDFIMTKFALGADQANNSLYSPCSVQQIKDFVETVENGHCFQPHSSNESLCGNGVVESGEECDCGDEETCRILEPGNCCDFKTCKLGTHAACSASNGFCCDGKTCGYKTAGVVCSLETECSYEAVCAGNDSKCLQPQRKDDFLECDWNSSVCMNGVCSGRSVCTKFGLRACFCEEKVDQCKICCISEDKCLPAQNITKVKSSLKSIFLSAGSLCEDRRGYCDVFRECHPINLNAPFSRRYDPYIRKKAFNEITHSFWWAIFLGTVGLIACVVMIIKHCALYTKSSCPELSEREPAKPWPRFKLSRLKEEEKGIILSDDINA